MKFDIKDMKIEMWPIEHLTPYETNVKKHEKEQVARIVKVIQRLGWRGSPIVVDRHGVIIAGHGRRLAAIEMGMKKVPVIVAADLDPEEVKALRLADNRVAISDIDTDMLKVELDGMSNLDLLEGVFDAKELDSIQGEVWEINTGALVDDMGAVLEEQKRVMDEKTESISKERIPLAKAFGFKDISADSQIHINRLMAKAEAATKLSGEEALVVFAAAL